MIPLKLAQAIDKECDKLYDEAETLARSAEFLSLKAAQLHSLEGAANSSNQVRSVAMFVEKQAGRDSPKFEGWNAKAGGPTVAQALARFSKSGAQDRAKGLVESLGNDLAIPENQRKSVTDEVALRLVRAFVAAFTIHYRYKQKFGEGRT